MPTTGHSSSGRSGRSLRRLRQVPVIVSTAGLMPFAAVQAASAGTKSPAPTPKVVARAAGTIVSVFSSPTATKPLSVLRSPTPVGAPLVFLVTDTTRYPAWLRVELPNRPNQSQGWIRGQAVTISSDAYAVKVELAAHKMVVTNGGRTVESVPIGEGRSVLPTPTGTYYIVELLKQPNPAGEYGPYAFGLSAYSDVLQSFGGGPGQIGIHGTDDPSSVGASVSHGCIRVANAVITRLARILPLGTPVTIVR